MWFCGDKFVTSYHEMVVILRWASIVLAECEVRVFYVIDHRNQRIDILGALWRKALIKNQDMISKTCKRDGDYM